ncbi:hypothetical protein P8C59_000335 [Phyllachora maydis]|uniref:Uncharacterized protein n=1 Tax=Phyllachora maydis TaxID=1825666 RepID=A0AAD9MA68_9PEZI|nr:hypothetical protein P8C59_000335 [Phyllachora maydis]
MDDATRLVQDLQDKLAELDTEVSAYQRDLLARFRRYMDARLQHVPDDVAHQVVRAIAESMASFPSLNPLPPPRTGAIAPTPPRPVEPHHMPSNGKARSKGAGHIEQDKLRSEEAECFAAKLKLDQMQSATMEHIEETGQNLSAAATGRAEDDSLAYDGPSLLDIEGEEDTLPKPKKVSSTQALQALTRSPLDEGTVWTVVNPDPAEPRMTTPVNGQTGQTGNQASSATTWAPATSPAEAPKKPIPSDEDRPEVELVEDVFEYEAEDEGSTVPEKTKYLPTEGLELDPPMDLPAQPAASTSQPRPVPPPRSAVSAPAMETATGSANMVGRSVGSYKGRSFNIPSIKDPRLYDEIANMENVHFFVGSIDGKSGAEAANMNSYRAMTSGAPSSTPRSFAERLMSEDIIELRENGWINDGSHGVGARADADDALPDVAEESESESDDGGLIDTTSNTGPMDGFGPSRRAALLRRQRKESRALRALMRSHYQALEEDDEPISPAAAEDAESTRREA